MENAVPPPQHHILARRLTFGSGTGLYSEVGWRLRVILLWQRLVRADKVRHTRSRSAMWPATRARARSSAHGHPLHLRNRMHKRVSKKSTSARQAHDPHGHRRQPGSRFHLDALCSEARRQLSLHDTCGPEAKLSA